MLRFSRVINYAIVVFFLAWLCLGVGVVARDWRPIAGLVQQVVIPPGLHWHAAATAVFVLLVMGTAVFSVVQLPCSVELPYGWYPRSAWVNVGGAVFDRMTRSYMEEDILSETEELKGARSGSLRWFDTSELGVLFYPAFLVTMYYFMARGEGVGCAVLFLSMVLIESGHLYVGAFAPRMVAWTLMRRSVGSETAQSVLRALSLVVWVHFFAWSLLRCLARTELLHATLLQSAQHVTPTFLYAQYALCLALLLTVSLFVGIYSTILWTGLFVVQISLLLPLAVGGELVAAALCIYVAGVAYVVAVKLLETRAIVPAGDYRLMPGA